MGLENQASLDEEAFGFKAKQASGTTALSLDFTAGSTTDGDITEAGTATDILSSNLHPGAKRL